MPWVRLDVALFTDDERFAALPDRLKVAYLALAAHGSRTDPPGTWRHPTHAEASLPGWLVEAIPDLALAGLLALGPDESISLRRRDFYPGETAGAERTRRYRDAHRDGHGDGIVSSRTEEPSTPSAPPPVGPLPARPGEVAETLPEAWYDVASLAESLTGRPYALPPFGRLSDVALRMVEKHGLPRVRDAMVAAAAEAGPMPTANQVILGASNALDAIPRVTPDCETCLNTGRTAKGARCPDCRRGRPDA